jgi:hypothetical protein
MDIDIEIFLNQLAQGVKPIEIGKKWFLKRSDSEQSEILRHLVFFIIQAGAVGSDALSTIEKSSLKPTFTPCHLLLKAGKEEPLGNRSLRQALTKICSLPVSERWKSFVLLVNLLGVADYNRRNKNPNENRHWWHQDLSDETLLAKIRKEFQRA